MSQRLVIFFQPELFLDRLELLAQEKLPLRFGNRRFDLLIDAALQLAEVELFFQQHERLVDPALQIERLEHILQLFAGRCRQRDGEVGQASRLGKIGMAEENLQLFFEKRVELEQLFDRRDDADRIGFELFEVFLAAYLRGTRSGPADICPSLSGFLIEILFSMLRTTCAPPCSIGMIRRMRARTPT